MHISSPLDTRSNNFHIETLNKEEMKIFKDTVLNRLCKTKSGDVAIYTRTTNELPRVCWQRDLNLRTWDNLFRLPMICESSEKSKGKFKKNKSCWHDLHWTT